MMWRTAVKAVLASSSYSPWPQTGHYKRLAWHGMKINICECSSIWASLRGMSTCIAEISALPQAMNLHLRVCCNGNSAQLWQSSPTTLFTSQTEMLKWCRVQGSESHSVAASLFSHTAFKGCLSQMGKNKIIIFLPRSHPAGNELVFGARQTVAAELQAGACPPKARPGSRGHGEGNCRHLCLEIKNPFFH